MSQLLPFVTITVHHVRGKYNWTCRVYRDNVNTPPFYYEPLTGDERADITPIAPIVLSSPHLYYQEPFSSYRALEVPEASTSFYSQT